MFETFKIIRDVNSIKISIVNTALEFFKGGALREHIRESEFRERKRSFGRLYKDKIFYVIRVHETASSIGALMLFIFKQLEMCELNGYIPVIDFSYFPNLFLKKEEVGKVNSWEYFFGQPTMYSTQAVYHAKNVILGSAYNTAVPADMDMMIDNEERLKKCCELYKKNIHISKRIEKKADDIYTKIISPEWRVLGCNYRGTDFKNKKAVGDHRMPSLLEEIEKAQELMEKWKCDHIFISTEDKGGLEKFREVFKDKLVYAERKRYPSHIAITQQFFFPRKQDEYFKGEEYLIDMYILAKCNCLLSGRSGIMAMVLPMNNQRYEHEYIYDLGIHTEADYQRKK